MSGVLEAFVSRLATLGDACAPREADVNGSRAAVAAIVRNDVNGAELLFIKRAAREADPWSGHMAFPGGHREKEDASLLATAIRETREEIGIDLARIAHPIARLSDVLPYSKMPHALTVTAFVFLLDEKFEMSSLAPNQEVARIIWAPLEGILKNERATKFRWKRDGMDLVLPAIDVDGEIVWGLTYRMLELLREAVA